MIRTHGRIFSLLTCPVLIALAMVVQPLSIRAQTALVNGANLGTNLTATTTNFYTFTAGAGNSIQLRMGATNFVPRIDLYRPDGTLLASAFTANGSYRDAALSVQLTNTGTFMVGASSYYSGQFGGYGLTLAEIPGAFVVLPGTQGGALTNGAYESGNLVLGGLAMWSFSGNAGDNIQLRMGATNFVPRIDLYGPDGTLVTSAFTANGSFRDAALALQLTNTGTFTVVAGSYYLNDFGGYALNLAQIPGAFVVLPGTQGGALTNGAYQTANLNLGELAMWSFSANAGDNIQLRMGATNFVPRIDLYGPDGTFLTNAFTANGSYRDAVLALQLTNSGTFTVVASSYYLNNYGGYALNLARVPGVFVVSPGYQGGTLTNGPYQPGNLQLGELAMWSFNANAGNSVQLRMGATNFVPRIDLYGPDGTLLASAFTANGANRDAELSLQLTNGGTFTVVASSYYLNNYGGYALDLALIGQSVPPPGGGGGALTNGVIQPGTIYLGTLDLWTFSGNAGDNIELRMGATNFVPQIDLYGPDGTLLTNAFTANGSFRDTLVNLQLTNSGTFTAVASSYYLGNSGGYAIDLVQEPESLLVGPGEEGGLMTNGVTYVETNYLGGQVAWNFQGTVGDSNIFRINTTNFVPWLELYGPSGALVAQAFTANGSNRTNFLSYVVTNSGAYTLVASSYYLNDFGTFSLKQSRVPPDLILPPTQTITDEGSLNVPVSAQDPDDPTKSLTFVLVSAPAGAALTTLGPTNASFSWTPTDADGPSTNVIVATVTDVVNGQSYTRTNSFTVLVLEVNKAPVLPAIAAQTVNELTLLTLTNAAAEPDLHSITTGYELINAPAGMSINSSGVITWTPNQTESPATNTITTVVTNHNPYDLITPQLLATNTFTVVVKEVNQAPVFSVVPIQTVNELALLTVTNGAAEPNIHSTTTGYGLINPPAGMTINSSGVITWTPSQTESPGTNVITTVVTNHNPYDLVTPELTATNTFTVVVKEVNVTPTLSAIPIQAVNELTLLSVTNAATESNIHSTTTGYGLVNPPAGMSINSSGVITWTPSQTQSPGTNTITTVVTNHNPYDLINPQLTATNTFTVVVKEVNVAPAFSAIPIQTLNELTLLSATNAATEPNAHSTITGYGLVNPPAGMSINSSGVITWTPSQTQSPGTNTITTVVTNHNPYDLINPQLTATNTFTVVVKEVNVAPTLSAIPIQTLNELTLLSVTNTATEPNIHSATTGYGLIDPPGDMSINSSGVITWTPSQTQSPGTNTITTVVTNHNPYDLINPQLLATNTFTVVVKEVNLAPAFSAIPTQTVNELSLLSVTDAATEPNIHATTTGYGLINPPAGMSISSSGVITWTPTRMQSPGTNTIFAVATNVDLFDTVNPHLTATNSFTVIVKAVNTAPVIQSISDQSVHVGIPFSLQVVASNPYLPGSVLTYSLDAAPTNMTISAAGGLISWTPSATQTASYLVTVRVTDNGSPPLDSTTSFHVTVTGKAPLLSISPFSSGLMQITITGDTGFSYNLQTSPDLANWTGLLQLDLTTSPFTYIDPQPATNSHRFYRLLLIQ